MAKKRPLEMRVSSSCNYVSKTAMDHQPTDRLDGIEAFVSDGYGTLLMPSRLPRCVKVSSRARADDWPSSGERSSSSGASWAA